MSLQVWLPLTKDLRNQGLATITTTGTPVFKDTGKLGAKSLDLNTRISFNCPALANKQTFSMTIWAKVNEDSTLSTNWVDVIGFTDAKADGTTGQLRWETCYGSGYTTRGISSHDNATYATGTNFGSIIGANKGVWYHMACTVNVEANEIKEYCNGELIHTITPNGGHLTGAFWLGQTGQINGEVQDVRIYDHCLSPQEVKEISKGLVLHYPLSDGNIESTYNYLENKSFSNYGSYGFGSKGTISVTTEVEPPIAGNEVALVTSSATTAGNGAVEIATSIYPGTNMNKDDTFTVTAYVKGKGATIGKRVHIHLYNTNGTNTQSTGKDYTFTNEWQRIEYTLK